MMAALLVFFPIVINVTRGLVEVGPAKLELMRSYAADETTVMRKLRVPHMLPFFFTALKVGTTLAFIGAIVGEFFGGTSNVLGRVVLQAISGGKFDVAWAAIIIGATAAILAAGLVNRKHDREVMKEAIEEEGRQVAHHLERHLNTLGIIAAISPLLGLLGTVIGMVEVFTEITTHGVGNPTALAGGIAQALITTASGLGIAIFTVFPYNYFNARIDFNGRVVKIFGLRSGFFSF